MNLEILNKSYDIRWVYPSDLNEDYFYKIGFAFWALIIESTNFVVGCDSRLSSESLKKSLIEWIRDSGKNVIDIWLCSTDMVYFATGKYSEVDVWIMLTASHNPKDYNGLKPCLKNAVPINMKEFWTLVKDFIINWEFKKSIKKWNFVQKDISSDFVDHVASFINFSNCKNIKVVADAGNGVAWVFMTKLATKLWFELIPLFFEPDGNFPNHHPSPIESENMVDLIKKLKEVKWDIWVAFDWDADRMFIVDEKGIIWSWTITVAMISKMILEKNPGKKVAYNAVCGNIVPETIEKYSWTWVITKSGHLYLKEVMNIDKEIVFAWEHSWHYYFPKNWNADSWVIAFSVILELILKSNKKPSELRSEFEKYYSTDEINSKVKNVADKLLELKNAYSSWIQEELDWLTIRYPEYWFNVRPSSNEPLFRLNVEANSPEILSEKSAEILNIIRN